MAHNVNAIPTKLFPWRINLIVDRIEYIRFHEANRDYDLAANPTSWNRTDFTGWRAMGKPKSIAAFTPE